ncbi:MAG: hypothetical protein P3B98_11870 [Gemmatimonadota bacterium]|nr:hypothetical protein [Gemmatimonadota bacterium]
MSPSPDSSARRSFLSRLAAGTAAFGAALAAGSTPLQAMTGREEFKPTRHPQDDWFDQIPGKHRMFFDTITPNGAAEGLTFANNYAVANKAGYGLEGADLAIVICYRHWATPFAFNDAVWAKYGAAWGKATNFNDPATNAPPVRNVWNAKGLPGRQPNRGLTVEMAVARGWHFAVCDLAARAFAGLAARPGGPTTDEIYAELKQSTLGNAHFTAAGIVAVDRAQERGYSYSYIG